MNRHGRLDMGRRLATGMLLLGGAAAQAGSCSVSSSGLAFGAYQPLTFAGKLTSADATSSATVSLRCTGITGGGSYSIALGPSSFGSGNRLSTRYLPNTSVGGEMMRYNLYTDASYSTIWSDGMTAGAPFTGTIPTGDSQRNHTAYGRVPAGQSSLKAGNYADVLTMTVTYSP
jgi:spore coat protein U-like protein